MRTVAIIQSRMTSSRFPGKALAPLAGIPMLLHVIKACTKAVTIDKIVVATSDTPTDEPLAVYLRYAATPAALFRGSLTNPLQRTYEAAKEAGADVVVRITADCPLIDYRAIDHVVCNLNGMGGPYFGTTNSPDGTDAEAFTMAALEEANDKASTSQREHTTTYMRDMKHAMSHEADQRYSHVHYSVNTPGDLHLCEAMLAMCGDGARWQDHVNAYEELRP